MYILQREIERKEFVNNNTLDFSTEIDCYNNLAHEMWGLKKLTYPSDQPKCPLQRKSHLNQNILNLKNIIAVENSDSRKKKITKVFKINSISFKYLRDYWESH